MQSTAIKINSLLENLEEEDYDKAVSYIEFLVTRRKEQMPEKKQQRMEKMSKLLYLP